MGVKYQLDGNVVRRCKDLIKSHKFIENHKAWEKRRKRRK